MMMRKHPTLRQSIFVLSAVCFGNDRKRVPLVSSLPRKKKSRASCPISTEIHLLLLRRSSIARWCAFSLPSRAMMMMMMKEERWWHPGEERKNERKKLLKASFFSLLGGKRKEKEEDHQFIWCQEFLLFFRVSLKFFLVCLSFFFKVKKTKSFVVLLLFRTIIILTIKMKLFFSNSGNTTEWKSSPTTKGTERRHLLSRSRIPKD